MTIRSTAVGTLMIAAVPGCKAQVAGPELPPGAVPVEFRSITELTGPIGGPPDPARVTIRDADAWARFWDELPKTVSPAPQRPTVDFKQEMLMVVAMGRRSSGGHHISIEGVYRHDGRLLVDVLEVSPSIGCLTTQVITTSITGVALASSAAPVEFLERRETRC